jgi:hypothetical protein
MLRTRAFALVCVAAVLLGVAGCKIDPVGAENLIRPGGSFTAGVCRVPVSGRQ